MEGVGGRVGRSSSRYGSTTVFTGPVRKWSKLWLPIAPNPTPNPTPPPSSFNIIHNSLRLYKWTPGTPPQEPEPPSKKFKFVPIAVLDEQKKENESAQVIKNSNNKKPDINNLPMEKNPDSEENQMVLARQDLNELDLSLGLTSHEEEHDSDA